MNTPQRYPVVPKKERPSLVATPVMEVRTETPGVKSLGAKRKAEEKGKHGTAVVQRQKQKPKTIHWCGSYVLLFMAILLLHFCIYKQGL